MKSSVYYQHDGAVVTKLAVDALQYDATALASKYKSRDYYYTTDSALVGDVKTMDEEEEREARRMRRRRQKAQVVNCCKKFIAFLFSHVGLAGEWRMRAASELL